VEKVVRVLKKLDAGAPHAVLLVLDAGVGQNALSQVAEFSKTAGVTGLAMTKLDGTARGGILVAVAEKYACPSTSSASARAWTISKRFRRASLPARSPDRMTSVQTGATHRHEPETAPSSALKLALDIGPLVLFFIGNARWGIFTATAVFMAAILVALARPMR